MLVGLWQMDREDLLAGCCCSGSSIDVALSFLNLADVSRGYPRCTTNACAIGARSRRRPDVRPSTCASVETAAPDALATAEKLRASEARMKSRHDGDRRSSSSSFFEPWPDRLRQSAIILLAAGLVFPCWSRSANSLARAVAAFLCIAAAALIPRRLHDIVASREDPRRQPGRGGGRQRGGRRHAGSGRAARPRRPRHPSQCAAAQLAPALRRNELAQFALRSPEIITALREWIATTEPRRATYLDHVPVDRWMELTITPVPVPTSSAAPTNAC